MPCISANLVHEGGGRGDGMLSMKASIGSLPRHWACIHSKQHRWYYDIPPSINAWVSLANGCNARLHNLIKSVYIHNHLSCVYDNEHVRAPIHCPLPAQSVLLAYSYLQGRDHSSHNRTHTTVRDIVQCTYGTILGEDVIPSTSFQHNPLTPYIAVWVKHKMHCIHPHTGGEWWDHLTQATPPGEWTLRYIIRTWNIILFAPSLPSCRKSTGLNWHHHATGLSLNTSKSTMESNRTLSAITL